MSCYEWEHGTFVLPSKSFIQFRNAVYNAASTAAFFSYHAGRTIYQNAVAIMKNGLTADGLGPVRDPYTALDLALEKYEDGLVVNYDAQRVREAILRVKPGSTSVLRAPIRRDFALNSRTNFSLYQFGPNRCASIGFSYENRTVTWQVHEGNRVIAEARDHPVARHFFYLLPKVKWTRNSGGSIIGSDEYYDDAQGHPSHYIKETFGNPRTTRE